jgi:hypothetical protein
VQLTLTEKDKTVWHVASFPLNTLSVEAERAEGWGGFDIVANIYFKSGEEKTVTVPLKLN